MELKKMREMTEVELNSELAKMKKELFNLRFQNATNQLDNTSRIKEDPQRKRACKSRGLTERRM